MRAGSLRPCRSADPHRVGATRSRAGGCRGRGVLGFARLISHPCGATRATGTLKRNHSVSPDRGHLSLAAKSVGSDRAARRPSGRSSGKNPGRFDPSLDAAILEAALAGLAEHGYDRTSMDDIAARARVGKAAIYRRWPSKAAVVADAIAHWRRGLGPLDPPDTGSLRGDIDVLVAAVPDFDEAALSTIKVIVGVATAAMHHPVLSAALDELALSTPRQIINAVLDHAVARGEIPAGRDLTLIPDALIGLNVLQLMTGQPIDRVYVRRALEQVLLPLTTADAGD
ncbi:MAG: TetR/AcrR family transcriptional regulator [Mycobacterium sp.]|nr:TetR/AcrR family transcriptional regulator [Mycobacterium sp.]